MFTIFATAAVIMGKPDAWGVWSMCVAFDAITGGVGFYLGALRANKEKKEDSQRPLPKR